MPLADKFLQSVETFTSYDKFVQLVQAFVLQGLLNTSLDQAPQFQNQASHWRGCPAKLSAQIFEAWPSSWPGHNAPPPVTVGARDQHLAKVGKCLARACMHKSCLTLLSFILAFPSKLFIPLQELVLPLCKPPFEIIP